MLIPRVIISSYKSSAGKTLITSGLIKALSNRLKVRGFKVGPDFIDPGYLQLASGYPAINLDIWLMGEDGVINSLMNYTKGFDIGIIEGVMGLYDGIGYKYSTYELSKVTKTPIVVIVDCFELSYTAGAIVKGLKDFMNADVRGVIFNKVASESHYLDCKASLDPSIKSLGYVRFDKELQLPSRHLGLYTSIEYSKKASEIISAIAKEIESNIDLDELINIANEAEELKQDLPDEDEIAVKENKVAAIALDAAFNFYYSQNLDIIKRKGYKLKFFSPLSNEVVDEADFIYIGGGYPELYLETLEQATNTKSWIKKKSYEGTPILAECGGLMYVSKYLIDENGRKFRMANIFDVEIKAKDKLTIGYTKLETINDNIISRKGSDINAHEFHISKPLTINEENRFAFKMVKGKGLFNGFDGLINQNTLASYSHFHFLKLQNYLIAS